MKKEETKNLHLSQSNTENVPYFQLQLHNEIDVLL
jgi:hypothetical protein